ncbi:MAG: hypothetical protein ACUVXF_10810 [Desulfobaccales bacterium]
MPRMVALLWLWTAVTAGCFHFRAIRSDIAPTGKAPGQSPLKTAVYFSPQLEILTKVTKPDTSVGGRHTYGYIMGPALQEALSRSVQATSPDYSVVKVLPRMKEFERIISFDLESSKVMVEFVPGYLNQQAKATADLIVLMEIIEGSTLKTLRRFRVQGRGTSSRDASGFNAYAAKHFTLAMEEAIRQLADLVTNLLSSGPAAAPGMLKESPR